MLKHKLCSNILKLENVDKLHIAKQKKVRYQRNNILKYMKGLHK